GRTGAVHRLDRRSDLLRWHLRPHAALRKGQHRDHRSAGTGRLDADAGAGRDRRALRRPAAPGLRALTPTDPAAAEICQYLARGIMAGRARDAAAGMGSRAALIEAR